MQTYKNFRTGQWVKSYGKGIHRIEKFIPVEYEEYHFFIMGDWETGAIKESQIGSLQEEPLVELKRLFNSKFKKQIGADYCSGHYLKDLTAEEEANVEEQIKSNPKYTIDLDKYVLPKFETRYGLNFSLTDDTIQLVKELAQFIRQDDGRTFTEIFEWLGHKNYKQLLYKQNSPSDRKGYYLQFINWNYQVRNNRLLLTDLLAFTPDFAKIDTI
ncbi:hypothetical protein [Pedobacter sp. UYP1]|uniref:hypothetical protein n=1 Tax=Pedobacter sp. UYP1 TaxID=1756396 RepID=UPI003390C228